MRNKHLVTFCGTLRSTIWSRPHIAHTLSVLALAMSTCTPVSPFSPLFYKHVLSVPSTIGSIVPLLIRDGKCFEVKLVLIGFIVFLSNELKRLLLEFFAWRMDCGDDWFRLHFLHHWFVWTLIPTMSMATHNNYMACYYMTSAHAFNTA